MPNPPLTRTAERGKANQKGAIFTIDIYVDAQNATCVETKKNSRELAF